MDELLTVDDALGASLPTVREWHEHVNPALKRLLGLVGFDRIWVKAEGTRVWDADGNEVLDFYGGYGSLNVGHNHPRVVEAVNKVAEKPNMLGATVSPFTGALGVNLARLAPGDLSNSFFCNSGAEAVEGALKLACAATGCNRAIVSTENAFHGKTCGALSVSGKDSYKESFPLVEEIDFVAYGDAPALEARLASAPAAAFIVEPIQGEAGVIVPPEGYLTDVRELCSKHGVLLILDEIQTGIGRTGKMFACEHEGVVPDVMTLAKSFGGGIAPIGAFTTTRKIWDRAFGGLNKAAIHTSTFGGNTRAAAAAIAALNVTVDERLPERAAETGAYVLDRLAELQAEHKMIKEVRGRGLMIGVEFYSPKAPKFVESLSQQYLASLVAAQMLAEHRILTAYTFNNPNVIRFAPPLAVTKEECDRAVEALDAVCAKNKGFLGTGVRAGKSVAKRLLKS
ncbi:MAG: aspartate aminotransferase family protein [Actinobacteria bacterium]|nr:MAG: aspartate aminotransferase family protein [Actinomycetota bacterium]